MRDHAQDPGDHDFTEQCREQCKKIDQRVPEQTDRSRLAGRGSSNFAGAKRSRFPGSERECIACRQRECDAGCESDGEHDPETNFRGRPQIRSAQPAGCRRESAVGAAEYAAGSECEPRRDRAARSGQTAGKSFTIPFAFRARNAVTRPR